MSKALIEKLHLKMEPVGIFLGNTDAVCDRDADPGRRNCLMPLIMSASKGTVISVNEESCNCAGGATGCCFGDGFSRFNPNIHKLLSQGFGENAPAKMPPMAKEGERFFCSEDLAMKWREDFPYSKKGYPRTVFAPFSRWNEIGCPDLVYIFADPDQISALVTLLGFHNGRRINTIVPFGAACQSIAYAWQQAGLDDPMAVMGLFDISQRYPSLAGFLSMTMPYCLFEKMGEGLDKSCLTSHSWRKIEENRFGKMM